MISKQIKISSTHKVPILWPIPYMGNSVFYGNMCPISVTADFESFLGLSCKTKSAPVQ